jgi:hypothetical protein
MRKTAAFLLVLMCSTISFAEPLKIVGKEQVDVYRLVKLTVEGADPNAGLDWDVAEADKVDVADTASGFQFTGPPGVYHVTLREIVVKDGKTVIRKTRFTITIGKAPVPTPIPGPTPTPDDKFGLRAISHAGALAVNDPDTAQNLGKQIRALASQVAAGGAGLDESGKFDPAVAMDDLRKVNHSVVKDVDVPKWNTGWGSSMNASLTKAYKDGKLPSKTDWVQAFNDIGAGLLD